MEEFIIIHSLEKNKFLAMDGNNEAGFLSYKLKGDIISINSTFVDPKYRNKFLGKKLLDQCVSYAREKGFKIFPRCSYVVRVFEKTNKYDDVKTI